MSDFFDPTTANDDVPEGPEGLKIILLKCSDIRSRNKVYESLENEYPFWHYHLLDYTKREYWEDIVEKDGIEKWADKMSEHMQWAMRNEYIFKI